MLKCIVWHLKWLIFLLSLLPFCISHSGRHLFLYLLNTELAVLSLSVRKSLSVIPPFTALSLLFNLVTCRHQSIEEHSSWYSLFVASNIWLQMSKSSETPLHRLIRSNTALGL